MTPVRVAIIGAGIGEKHYIAYRELPEMFEVAAICDVNTARASRFVDAQSGTRVTDDFEALLADPAIDLIDICLPPHLHMSFTERALRAGKHVVCEKPLCNSLAEADRLIAVAKETGCSVFPVFQYRFGKGFAQLKALIEAGLAGKAFTASLETHWNRGADYYAVDWRGTWTGEQGGAILGHAIHMHDLVSYILGPAEEVFAMTATRVNAIEVEDCAALSMRMQSGALVTSSVTLGAANDTSRLRFCFAGLTAESGDLPYTPAEGDWTFTARAPFEQDAIDAVLQNVPDAPPGQTGFSAEVFRAMQGEPSRVVTLDDARRSIEFVTAVYESSRSGKPVRLPLGGAHPMYEGWLPAS